MAEWKPIDKPPEEHKPVLVIFDDGVYEVARLVDGAWLSNDNLDYNYGFDIPVYWQRLPKSPFEDK